MHKIASSQVFLEDEHYFEVHLDHTVQQHRYLCSYDSSEIILYRCSSPILENTLCFEAMLKNLRRAVCDTWLRIPRALHPQKYNNIVLAGYSRKKLKCRFRVHFLREAGPIQGQLFVRVLDYSSDVRCIWFSETALVFRLAYLYLYCRRKS